MIRTVSDIPVFFDTSFGTRTLRPVGGSQGYFYFYANPFVSDRKLERSISYPVLLPQDFLKKIKVQAEILNISMELLLTRLHHHEEKDE